MMALCMEIPIGFKLAKKVIHLLHLQDLLESSPLLLFLIGQVQVLGMTAVAPPSAPQVLPSAIRREPNYNSGNNGAGLEGRISPKRAYYAAFEAQMGAGSADEMVDEEEMMMFATAGAGGETGAAAAAALLKKRRLTMEQVRYLESSFESENKLEPERKAEIARQLGLQPRQVAVWFQNRRARSKNKQLERDYNVLKADYHAVLKENEELRAEVQRLNDLLQEGESPQHGDRGPVNKRKRLLATSNINVSGGSAESDQPKQMAQVMATSTTSGGELVAGNIEVGDGEDCMSSPCTLLTEYGNASPAIPLQTTATALVVVPNEHVSLGLEELLNNCMHGTAHQFNLYAQWPDSSFHHDSSLLIASWEEDDPFARST